VSARSVGGLFDPSHIGDLVKYKGGVYEVLGIGYSRDLEKDLKPYKVNGTGVVKGKLENRGHFAVIQAGSKTLQFLKYGAPVASMVSPAQYGLSWAKGAKAHKLKPQDFYNLVGKKYGLKDYHKAVKVAIDKRTDLSESIRDFLHLLTDYYMGGTKMLPKSVEVKTMPINEIQKNFGELLGPFYLLHIGMIDMSWKAFFPVSGNEPLVDFYVYSKDEKSVVRVSSKAGGSASNTVKGSDLIKIIGTDKMLQHYKKTQEYEVLQALTDNSVNTGAFYAAMAAKVPGFTKKHLDSIAGVKSSRDIDGWSQLHLFTDLINKNKVKPKKEGITDYGYIRYELEKLLVEQSKNGTLDFTSMFKAAIISRVHYLIMNRFRPDGAPNFDIKPISGKAAKIPKVVLRTKNGYSRAADKVGLTFM